MILQYRKFRQCDTIVKMIPMSIHLNLTRNMRERSVSSSREICTDAQ